MLKRIDFISITLLVIIFCLAFQSRAQVKEKKGETNSTNQVKPALLFTS